jgi:hypothetical protein
MTWARKMVFDQMLKRAFPRTRFRVTVDLTVHFEECISIRWTNGPTERAVNKLIGAPGPRRDICTYRTVKPTHLQLVK